MTPDDATAVLAQLRDDLGATFQWTDLDGVHVTTRREVLAFIDQRIHNLTTAARFVERVNDRRTP